MSSVAVFSSLPTEVPSFPEHDAKSFAAKRARAVGELSSSVRPASALEVRPAPAMVPFGINGLDALTGGVPRGALTELFGPASSGRSSVMLSLMASVTRRQEVCALIDVTDSFDPLSGEAAGIDLRRMLWVRCGKSGQCTVDSGQKVVSASSQSRPRSSSMNSVAPPAKNISWSIHQNYDTRLRHAITGGCFEMTRGREAVASSPQQMWERAHSARSVMGRKPVQPEQGSTPASLLCGRAGIYPGVSDAPLTRALAPDKSPTSKWTRLDQALKATDLLLQSGGFGLIVIDLGDISAEQAHRIPLTSWFRFRRVVENTPTILLLVARDSCAKTCASLVLQLSGNGQWSGSKKTEKDIGNSGQIGLAYPLPTIHYPLSGTPSTVHRPHTNLLDGLDVRVELVRTRLERKPARSTGSLQTQTLWRKSG